MVRLLTFHAQRRCTECSEDLVSVSAATMYFNEEPDDGKYIRRFCSECNQKMSHGPLDCG